MERPKLNQGSNAGNQKYLFTPTSSPDFPYIFLMFVKRMHLRRHPHSCDRS